MSGFQARSLIGDIVSDAPKRIASYANKVDGILLDIATDRRGVYDIGGGRYISHTYELGKSGLLKNFPQRKFIEFGSDQHKKLFTEAATKIKSTLLDAQVFEKVFLLSFPYTQVSDSDAEVPLSLGKTAIEWNQLTADYYAILLKLDFNLLDLPANLAVSTSTHTWGIGQDHLVDGAYAWWAEQIYSKISSTS